MLTWRCRHSCLLGHRKHTASLPQWSGRAEPSSRPRGGFGATLVTATPLRHWTGSPRRCVVGARVQLQTTTTTTTGFCGVVLKALFRYCCGPCRPPVGQSRAFHGCPKQSMQHTYTRTHARTHAHTHPKTHALTHPPTHARRHARTIDDCGQRKPAKAFGEQLHALVIGLGHDLVSDGRQSRVVRAFHTCVERTNHGLATITTTTNLSLIHI